MGERDVFDQSGLPKGKYAELWEKSDAVEVGIGDAKISVSVAGARKLARLLLDVALRVEKRQKAAQQASKSNGNPSK